MDNDNEQRIRTKIEFFMNNKIKVHVELFDKTFLNGLLVREIKNGVYWLVENKLGEVFLFIKDIYDIDKYNEIEEIK